MRVGSQKPQALSPARTRNGQNLWREDKAKKKTGDGEARAKQQQRERARSDRHGGYATCSTPSSRVHAPHRPLASFSLFGWVGRGSTHASPDAYHPTGKQTKEITGQRWRAEGSIPRQDRRTSADTWREGVRTPSVAQ